MLFVVPSNASEQTIPYMNGVPVLKGFTVMQDDILVFDKPEGQIVQISLWCASNCPSAHETNVAYRKIFENLGWHADDVMGFYKGDQSIFMELQQTLENKESLIITFHSKG